MPDLLFSVDPEENRFRFFAVELRVLGERAEAELHLRWGRVGTEGRRKVLTFPMAWDAQKARGGLLKRREAHGYRRNPEGPQGPAQAPLLALLALLRREVELDHEVESGSGERPRFEAVRELGHTRRALSAAREAMRWEHEAEEDTRQLRLVV